MDTRGFIPQTGVLVRLLAAALLWLVGALMVLRLALGFIAGVGWVWWVIAAGLALGLAKSRFIMNNTARRTIARTRSRERDWLLNLYAPKTWIILAAMMTLGILLRNFGPLDNVIYQHFLAILYLTVGLGLLLSDIGYWKNIITGH